MKLMPRKEQRPKIKIELTFADRMIDTFALFSLGALWALTVYYYTKFPETIPTHFNATGKIDSYGNRFTIFSLPAIATFLFILLSAVTANTHVLNYPVKITNANALKQYSNASKMVRLLKLIIMIVFITLLFQVNDLVNQNMNKLSFWQLPIELLIINSPIIFFFIRSKKAQ